MLEINKIYNMDCLEGMKLIDDNSIDLIVTDPPYNISRKNNFKTMGRSGIDFGEWDKNFNLFLYIDAVYKKLTKNGSFIVFNDWKNLGDIATYSEKLGFITKDMIRLEKTNPMPRNRDRRYITDFECAIWFTKKGGEWVFNRQDKKYERPKFIGNIEKGLHPTQKNVKLIEWLIKIHSNKNQTICDPFMGSGTTAVACIKTNRNFIGFELSKDYFNIAQARIKRETAQVSIFDSSTNK